MTHKCCSETDKEETSIADMITEMTAPYLVGSFQMTALSLDLLNLRNAEKTDQKLN